MGFSYRTSLIDRIVFLSLSVWFVSFLILFESVTGLAILSFLVILAFGYFMLSKKTSVHKIAYAIFFLALVLAFFGSAFRLLTNHRSIPLVDTSTLELITSQGNSYVHDTLNTQLENGNYIWMYQCKKELEENWKERSELNYNGLDKKGQELEYTLIRFLSSKGFRKDAEGLLKLTDNEIKAVENGIANVNGMSKFSIYYRLGNIFWEIDDYQRGGDPSGHSVVQRLEYWKAALLASSDNLFFGVGTGDVMTAMNIAYDKNPTLLKFSSRKRPHNQFLSVFVGFGLFGLCWFLFALFYPLKSLLYNINFNFYVCFWIVAMSSMLTEDTLDTQAGVSFFAFINSYFLFVPINEK
jgi:O-antigen ligase